MAEDECTCVSNLFKKLKDDEIITMELFNLCGVLRAGRVSVHTISYSAESLTQEEKRSHRPHCRSLQRSMCSNAEPREPSEPSSGSDYPGVGMCNENGTCYCNQTSLGDCFVLRNNSCQLKDCYQYIQEQGTCRKDTRRRTAAILLSFILINFGTSS